MYTGLWTVVILDNNGNDSSVAFQRSFNLTLAVPSSNISSSVAPATSKSPSTRILNSSLTGVPPSVDYSYWVHDFE